MCFSAGASFVTSGALAATGAAAIQKTKKLRLIAFTPVLFAIQQFSEGLQWIVRGQGALGGALGYFFLFFAFLLWPVYVPLAVLESETSKKKRQYLRFLILAGILTSTYFLFVLLTNPLIMRFHTYGIEYAFNVHQLFVGFIFYATVIFGSLFISSRSSIRRFGILILISAVFSLIFFLQTFISVWCFFAAVISLYIYFAILKGGRTGKKQ